MRPEFDMTEVRQFAEAIEAAPPELIAKVRGSLTRHANEVAKRARANAPKDRPWLSTPEGITVRTGQSRLSRVVESGPDPRGKPVGLFVEFGTSRMPPRPFMFTAFNEVGPGFVDDLARILDGTPS